MPIRRPRLRIRTLMAVVAIVALLIFGIVLYRRSARFAALAVSYDYRAQSKIIVSAWEPSGVVHHVEYASPGADLHAKLRDKYRYAAAHPWLPVAPDPPEPE